MNTFAPKSTAENQQASQERKRLPSRDGLPSKASASLASVLIDNWPQAMAQRKLNTLTDQRPQGQRLAHAPLQAMLDNSPRQVAQQQQSARLFGLPVQRQEGLDEEELQMQAEPGKLQRQSLEDEELIQGKMAPVQWQEELEEEALHQGQSEITQRQAPEDEDLLQEPICNSEAPTQRQGAEDVVVNRTGMPDSLKEGLEQLSGVGLSGVRVHHNSSKPAQLNALAYAQGQDIHLGPGQERYLPHEGWHAVQQMQGRVKPAVQAQGVSINDDEGLEREADLMGAKAAWHQASKSTEPDPMDSARAFNSVRHQRPSEKRAGGDIGVIQASMDDAFEHYQNLRSPSKYKVTIGLDATKSQKEFHGGIYNLLGQNLLNYINEPPDTSEKKKGVLKIMQTRADALRKWYMNRVKTPKREVDLNAIEGIITEIAREEG